MTTGNIDVLILGAKVVDGTGNPWYHADIALGGDRILEIAPPGRIPAEAAREVVDASGMVLCPGFIDILSHSHIPLMHDPRALSKITQGVTTEIMGEGWTPAPTGGRIQDAFLDLPQKARSLIGDWPERAKSWSRLRHWLDAMVERGVSPNIGSFLGGGTLREYARGLEMGTPTPTELETMRRVMAEAMEDGAFGVSYALIYPPDTYTSTSELIEVAKVAARYGGIYVTHLRSEGDHLLEAIDEAVEIGRQAQPARRNLPPQGNRQAQLAQDGPGHRAHSGRTRCRRRCDRRHVPLSSLRYRARLHPAALGGRRRHIFRDTGRSIRTGAHSRRSPHTLGRLGTLAHGIGPQGVMPVGLEQPENLQYAGKPLSEIASMRGQHWLDAVIELLLSERQRIFTIYSGMDEANVALGLQQPWVKISTDAGGVDPAWAKELGPTHPREYGTYPRVLAKYVRQEKLLTLEDAIRKMSGAVAARLGLRDRGLLLPGCYAD